jgi:hypothetical protein
MWYVLRCDGCKAGLTSSVFSPTNTFIHFKEYRDDKQSLTYQSESLVQTVSVSVTVLERTIEVAHTDSVGEKITAEIKKPVDFGWIPFDCCSLHQDIPHGTVRSVTRIAIAGWFKRTNRSLIQGKQEQGYSEDENRHTRKKV